MTTWSCCPCYGNEFLFLSSSFSCHMTFLQVSAPKSPVAPLLITIYFSCILWVACNQGSWKWCLCLQSSVASIWSGCNRILPHLILVATSSAESFSLLFMSSRTIPFSLDLSINFFFFFKQILISFPPPTYYPSNQSGAFNIAQSQKKIMLKHTDSQANTHLFLDHCQWVCMLCRRKKPLMECLFSGHFPLKKGQIAMVVRHLQNETKFKIKVWRN